MYFKDFPLTNFYKSDGTVSQAIDVLRRVVFTKESYLQESAFDNYYYKDGDTPEKLATKFYNDPELHWVIILYNTAFDPFYSFPLSRNSFREFLDKKYEGQALFLSPLGESQTPMFTNETTALKPGEKISTRYYLQIGSMSVEKFNSTTQHAIVKRVDNQLSKIETSKHVGPLFQVDDVIARRSTILDTKYRSQVTRAVAALDALHHFELAVENKEVGIMLDPLRFAPEADGTQPEWSGYYGSLLQNYTDGDNSYVITNRQYETRLNESRMKIRIPKKSVVQKVIEEFETLISA